MAWYSRILGLDNPHGIIIEKVVKNSAADHAGLQPFDYLYRINDQEFTEDYGLTQALRAQQSGDEVVLYFIRKGSSKNCSLFTNYDPYKCICAWSIVANKNPHKK